MALVKIILGLGAVVLFMPTDKETQTKVYDATAHAVERVATFCVRNPETCQRGGAYWAVFKQKAEFGAKMAWTLAVDRMNAKGDQDSAGDAEDRVGRTIPIKQQRVRTEPNGSNSRGTLTAQDLQTPWRPAAQPKRGI